MAKCGFPHFKNPKSVKSTRIPKAIYGVTDLQITHRTRVRLLPDIVFREEIPGFLLYDTRNDILFEGNETGKEVLVLCDGRHTVGEIVHIFSGSSGVSREEISGYIMGFLTSLLENEVVECIDGSLGGTG